MRSSASMPRPGCRSMWLLSPRECFTTRLQSHAENEDSRVQTVPVRDGAPCAERGCVEDQPQHVRTHWMDRACCGWFLVAALLQTQPRSSKSECLHSSPAFNHTRCCPPFLNALANAFALCHASVSYTHLRAHETVLDLVCRLLL